jgi:signal transduction histidine kinase
MHTDVNRSANARAHLDGAEAALSRALAQGLDTPLAALRATVESLEQELQHGARPRPQRIDGVLREVDRLGRNVGELVDFASPPVPSPLACTLDEIVEAARAQLPLEQRRRVIAARCEPGKRFHVDGPLLALCLRRVLENALEATAEPVFVVARRLDRECTLSVFDGAPSPLGPGWQPVPFRSSKPNHLGLGLTLVKRDVALLGGRLEFPSSPPDAIGEQTCVRITLPTREEIR